MGVFYCINNTDKNILVCYIYILHIHTHRDITHIYIYTPYKSYNYKPEPTLSPLASNPS